MTTLVVVVALELEGGDDAEAIATRVADATAKLNLGRDGYQSFGTCARPPKNAAKGAVAAICAPGE